MAVTPEGKVKRALKNMLASEFPSIWTYWPVSNGMGAHGIPDLLMCVNGMMIGVEVKSDTGRLTALQHAQIAGIRNAGGNVYIVYGLGDVDGLRVLLNTMDLGAVKQEPDIKFWHGTKAEYDMLVKKDAHTIYHITD